MPTLSISKNYADGDPLFEADLDAIRDDIETFLNTTKLDNSNIQDNGVDASLKLVDGTVTGGKLASAAVTTSKIADSAVTTGKIADLNVTTGKLADSAVTTAKIADSNVTTAKIADSNVTTAKIADSNVTTAKIADSNVTTAKIADSNVTTAKIADANVTKAKLAALGQQAAGPVSFTSTGSTAYQATGLSATISTTGRPVAVVFTGTLLGADNGGGGAARAVLLRNGAQIVEWSFDTGGLYAGGWVLPDVVGAGTYTYTISVRPLITGDQASLGSGAFFIYEL
jgi:hypothetical protein